MIRSFDDLETRLRAAPARHIGLVMAEEAESLIAIDRAASAGLVKPVLIGDPDKITKIAASANLNIADYHIAPAFSEADCLDKAASGIRGGSLDALMKGKCTTAGLVKRLIDPKGDFRGSGRISHISLLAPRHYHKMLILTDPALAVDPDINVKIDLLRNALDAARKMEVEKPKAALICALEKVNQKMKATTEAAILSKMADRGEFGECFVDGPLALDNAVSRESCQTKGIVSPVGGDADILILPNLEAANACYKALTVLSQEAAAGFLIGSLKPVILTSRAARSDEKYLSIIAAAWFSSP